MQACTECGSDDVENGVCGNCGFRNTPGVIATQDMDTGWSKIGEHARTKRRVGKPGKALHTKRGKKPNKPKTS